VWRDCRSKRAETSRVPLPVIFCDACDNATTQCQRGWRAFLVEDRSTEAPVLVLCPTCSECLAGADEERVS
jgi:hypothetical protein